MPHALAALAAFRGIKRRLELRGTVNGVTVYDDFAHHPTAIATTLDGLRRAAGAARIFAVLEPRSNTMKLGTMKAQLPASLAAADRVFCYAANLGWDVAWCARPAGGSRGSSHRPCRADRGHRARSAGRRSDCGDEQWRLRRHSRQAAGAPCTQALTRASDHRVSAWPQQRAGVREGARAGRGDRSVAGRDAPRIRRAAIASPACGCDASVSRRGSTARRPASLAFVGSSLGGFYATWLAERYDAKAVMINPSVRPFTDLERYLGPQRNLYTGEEYELTRDHFAELAALRIARITRPGTLFSADPDRR